MSAPRFALVAGELSGDRLGAGLIAALRERYPRAEFFGVGGPRMCAAGFTTLAPLETLSVMGLIEPLRHLPELVRLRRRLYRQIRAASVSAFVGIDAPDFNLGLARRLRATGIPSVQYVSPQVWAWRRYRARKIARSVDLMLTLFPFEVEFYRQHRVPVRCVGHPLADRIGPRPPTAEARAALGLPAGRPLLALLPGSRLGEARRLGPPFVAAARRFLADAPAGAGGRPLARLAAANDAVAAELRALLAAGAGHGSGGSTDIDIGIDIDIVSGRTREVIGACDLALAASGTVTLETLLLKKPLVVAYKVAPVTAWLARRLVSVPYFSLPNLLAGEPLVDEFFQAQAEPETLATALRALHADRDRCRRLVARFDRIHDSLRRDASRQAAAALAELLRARAGGALPSR